MHLREKADAPSGRRVAVAVAMRLVALLALVALTGTAAMGMPRIPPRIPLADGFDFPVGDPDGGGSYVGPDGRRHEGWYVATSFGEQYALGLHPGEDWNGRGGGNTDLGQPVYAIGAGRVLEAGEFGGGWGRIVVLEHRFREGGSVRTVRSLYAHLARIDVTRGDVVARRERIGTIGRGPGDRWLAHLHFEIRTDLSLPPTHWPSSNGEDLDGIRRRYEDPRAFLSARRRIP